MVAEPRPQPPVSVPQPVYPPAFLRLLNPAYRTSFRIDAKIFMHTFILRNRKSSCFFRTCLWTAFGCLSVTLALSQSASAETSLTNQQPTYLRDILPIIMGKCSRCHNEEQARFVYNWLD